MTFMAKSISLENKNHFTMSKISKSLNVIYVKELENAAPENVPQVLAAEGAEYHAIGCDNWNWSQHNPDVSFAIAHCGDAIILHFHVKDHELRAVETTDDGRVWEDSCCEFFVSPGCDNQYYNFECNCIGTLLLHGGVKPDRPCAPQECYDSVLRWSSLGSKPIEKHPEDAEWDLVKIIPVSALFQHDIQNLSGRTMRANFYKCGDLLDSPHFLSWAPISLPKPAFHCPEFFGEITFD